MKNKIVILTSNTSWYLYNFRSSTISALIKKGYKVICLSPHDDYSLKLYHELGCTWIDISIDNKGMNPFKDLALIFSFIRHYYRLKPDVVFNFTLKNNVYSTLACSLFRTKSINNVSGLGTAFIEGGFKKIIVKLLYRLSQPFAHKVCCQNPTDMNLLINEGLVNKKKLEMLPGSGVDVVKFHPGLKSQYPKSKEFRFIFVGRMLGDKGLRELMTAVIRLFNDGINFHLQLCGSVTKKNTSAIPESEMLEFAKLSCVDWKSHCDDIEEYYANSDCVILPSYREGMPRTLLEAGAMGLPSIASNVPGCNHIISNGFNGLLCDVRCAQSIYEQMKIMINMKNLEYQAMAINSRNRVERDFDEAIVVRHALKLVESL